MQGYVKIDVDKFKHILKSAAIGDALMNGGVREWSGYFDAVDIFCANTLSDDTKGYENLDEVVDYLLEFYLPHED